MRDPRSSGALVEVRLIDRSLAQVTVVVVGAVSADMCQGRYPGEMVASAPVGDAEVMPGLGPVPLGRWQSATEER